MIGVLVAGWHTGLILPVGELGTLRSELPVYPDERYVSFGWGNRRFYMTSHPSFSEALEALFRSASAVLVEGASTVGALLPPGGTYRWICADRQNVVKIDGYLRDSLRTHDGKPIVLGSGPTSQSEFLASRERYDAFHTCNTWTAAALDVAGLGVLSDGVIFAGQVRDRTRTLPVCHVTSSANVPVAELRPPRRLEAASSGTSTHH